MTTAGWRLGLLCLVIAALSACATHRDAFAGIRYQTPTASFDLTPACVDRIRATDHTPPTLRIHVTGPCQARFQRFFRTHRGQAVTAAFQGTPGRFQPEPGQSDLGPTTRRQRRISMTTTLPVYLERIDASRRMARSYAIRVERTLFGDWAVIYQWGRIGARGRRQEE